MATKKQTKCKPPEGNANPILMALIITALIIIAIASVTNASLALKDQSQGNSGVVRQQCLNGLENAAIEAGVCSMNDLQQFENIIIIRETQGIKAAKDACRSLINESGCRGLCVAAVNCYDLGI